jgi:hypothetical protein
MQRCALSTQGYLNTSSLDCRSVDHLQFHRDGATNRSERVAAVQWGGGDLASGLGHAVALVESIVYAGRGHAWPGEGSSIAGSLVWTFFSRHGQLDSPRPG